MFAVFSRRHSELTQKIEKSLPQRETSLLTIIDLSERPSFSLPITSAGTTPAVYLDGRQQLLTAGLALSFPAFDPPPDLENPDYYTASWQSAFLALQESLRPNMYPHTPAADWIASFELSYTRRPDLAARLEVPFPPSRLLDGAYLPEGRELVYSLESRAILPTDSGQPLNGFLEVFPSTDVNHLHSAVILRDQCWLIQFTPQGMQPLYQGPIAALEPAILSSMFSRAAVEWGLANLVFLFDGSTLSLLQVRFDVEPSLHPAHYPSFAQAVATLAAAHA